MEDWRVSGRNTGQAEHRLPRRKYNRSSVPFVLIRPDSSPIGWDTTRVKIVAGVAGAAVVVPLARDPQDD